MHSNLVFIVGISGLVLYLVRQNQKKKKEIGKLNSDENVVQRKLGPSLSENVLRYELKLRGRVDTIYDHCGPKPFEFNEEVVNVFDDMVSRSVPLYCEVTDLLLYWVQRYFQPGSCICDLGCSTGTTLDVVAQYLLSIRESFKQDPKPQFVGIDNSPAMVQECRKKLGWIVETGRAKIEIFLGNISDMVFPQHTSFVIMNYTLQFIPVTRRSSTLKLIYDGLSPGGVLFLSEKVRAETADFQETCTWIYEDFKRRRGYSEREVARKKEALMNVLVPYSERELREALYSAGFTQVEIVAKWNNFSTFVARRDIDEKKMKIGLKPVQTYPSLDLMFDESKPEYLSTIFNLDPNDIHRFCEARLNAFSDINSTLSVKNIRSLDEISHNFLQLPKSKPYEFNSESSYKKWNQSVLEIGDPKSLNEDQQNLIKSCLVRLKPWKKGPLRIFGVDIDTEWRSDWKWDRIAEKLPDLENKVVLDLGCGNGYFMFRLLAHRPRFVLGIDPNLHAWVEFQLFTRFSGVQNMKLELLKGDSLKIFNENFDCVLCLGVLYHTPDPVGMLRDIHTSLKPGGTVVVDCCGIPGAEPIALFPSKRYSNMTGVYFFPTVTTLQNWMKKANFIKTEIIWAEKLSTEEQRITEWAPVTTSLKESLDPLDDSKTIEGYPAPYRFYITGVRG